MKEKFESVKQENKRLLEIINAKPLETVDIDSAFEIEKLQEQLHAKEQECEELKQTLAEIKEIIEPYKMTIKKICGNCKKYDDCHACCYKDINCYKYTSSETSACEEFTYLDEFIPNLLANNILQKISEVTENENS